MNIAKELTIRTILTESNQLLIEYAIDTDFKGSISIRIPIKIRKAENGLQLIMTAMGIFVGQLCLAQKIHFLDPIPTNLLNSLKPLAQLLYNVRAYRDQLRPDLIPEFIYVEAPDISPHNPTLDMKHAILLWGGGKDSTYSHLLLKANNYQVSPIHSNANYRSSKDENDAVHRLGQLLNTNVRYIEIDFPDMVNIGKRYSEVFDTFPTNNAIPHGRDLILVLVGMLVALELGAGNVCFGHEADLWHKKIDYCGVEIYRHDTQSETANVILQRALELIYPGLRIFSPIASLTEFRILQTLFDKYPDIMSAMSSCFWGSWCGACSKCLRYALVQSVSEKSIIQFKTEPLSDNNPTLLRVMRSLNDPNTPYWDEVMYCLHILALQEDNENWKDARGYFLREIEPQYETEIPKLLGRLRMEYPAALTPESFRIQLS